MRTSIIRPGLLVALKTSLVGGITYEQLTLDPDHAEGKARVAKWETKRTIANADEHQAATVARGRVRTLLRAVCAETSFGLICPQDRVKQLESAIAEAQGVADAHNRTARTTRVEFWVLTGRIPQDDAQAQRAIASEMRELITAMETGIKAADADMVREAANKAKRVAGLLSPEAGAKVGKAIEEVRAAARQIVQRVQKAGEEAADVIAEFKLGALKAARFSVLDLGEEETAPPAAPAAPPARSLDMTPGEPFARPKAKARAVEV
jgi:hypothetical protein